MTIIRVEISEPLEMTESEIQQRQNFLDMTSHWKSLGHRLCDKDEATVNRYKDELRRAGVK